jgi:hypothetical protein
MGSIMRRQAEGKRHMHIVFKGAGFVPAREDAMLA